MPSTHASSIRVQPAYALERRPANNGPKPVRPMEHTVKLIVVAYTLE